MKVSAKSHSDDRLTEDEFALLIEPLRPALRLHCYRLVGSLDDAEDMVQEALVRVWSRRDRLYDLSGFRPWVYRIATNVCLDLLDRRRRRPTVASSDAEEFSWPDPVPSTWLAGIAEGLDPAEGIIQREGVGLAFLAAVHALTPRQRAILVLRDVLEWPAAEVAEALETTTVAVNSALQRARAVIRVRGPEAWTDSSLMPEGEARRVAQRYLDAWERADTRALAALLTADARMAMPPDPRVFSGRVAIVNYFESSIFSQPVDQRFRLAPTTASGQPAFIVLAPDLASGAARRIGLKVLFPRHGQIAEIRGYMRADLAARFEDQAGFTVGGSRYAGL
jgi:RNA polymerase sigma-70 factor (ECF subfamily)